MFTVCPPADGPHPSAARRREFDRPPSFQPTQRRLFFSLPEWATQVLATLVAPHSWGGFVLQVGYFKAAGRFFLTNRFPVADQAYVQQRYDLGEVDWARYDRVTRFQHCQLILQHFGVLPFEQAEETVLAQVTHLARQQMNPAAVFRVAADFARSQRVEVPTFATLATLITRAFRTVEQQLLATLAQHLTSAVRQQLDALFTPEEEEPADAHRPYRLTRLKRSLEMMRPSAIRANVQDYLLLQTLFERVQPMVQALDLLEEVVRYYARYVERAQVFQVQQQADKKYLLVLCFVIQQAVLSTRRPTHRHALASRADPPQRRPARNQGARVSPAAGLGRAVAAGAEGGRGA